MDTWTNRDLPVLRAIVALSDSTGTSVRRQQIVDETGFDDSEVGAALRALAGEQPPFFTVGDRRAGVAGYIGLASQPTGHARRAVGSWPTPESVADRLVSGLDAAADREQDPERKGWLRKTAAYLGSAGRDITVEIAATALNKQIGMTP